MLAVVREIQIDVQADGYTPADKQGQGETKGGGKQNTSGLQFPTLGEERHVALLLA